MEIEVSARAVRLNVAAALFATIATAVVAAWRGDTTTQPWLWLAITASANALAWWTLGGGAASLRSRFKPAVQGRILALVAVSCSLSFGAASWLLLPGQDNVGFTVIYTTIAINIVGASAGNVFRPVVLGLSIPGPVVFALGLMHLEREGRELLAIGMLIVGAVAILLSSSHMKAVRVAVRLGAENERLLAESIQQRQLAELARAEAEQARHTAELADRGKTAFMAAAGHDLRQPLHALVQYHANLVRRNLDVSLQDTVTRIGKSLDAMRDLLDAMLEVSKLLTGTIRPHVGRVPLDVVLDRLDAQLRPLAQAKGLDFSLKTDVGTVETDEVLLERILRNLMLNAIRYTQSGRVGLRASRRGATCRLLVWDTGIGIARAEQSRIFDEFYQVANEARDARKGLGLGLAIVRQLGQLLQHRIRLRSMPQRGSVFALDLPMCDAAAAPEKLPLQSTQPDFTRGTHVVLVDDNPDSLAATAETLRAFGAHVVTAASGLEAIDRLQAQEFAPQLVVSDYRLEGETGLDVIALLRENQRALFGDDFEMAALLITGDTAPDELRKAQAAGVTLLHKPLSPDRLYIAVNAHLAQLAGAG